MAKKKKTKMSATPFGAQGGGSGNMTAAQKATPQGPGQNRPYSSPSPVSRKKNPRGK